MSLLSRDRLVIGLAPERLSALRVDGRLRPRIGDRYASALQAANGGQWDASIAALEILLDEPSWAARDLTLVLSSHYVHYALIPQGKGLAAAERDDLARLIFRNIFGELSSEWEIRVSPSGGPQTVASAVPQAFLKALHDICDGRGRLRSIQPGLMAVFNRARPEIGSHSGTLALVEPGRVTLAAIENGQWQSVVSRAGRSGTLVQLLEDESELYGRSPGGALWLCDLAGEVQLPSGLPWQLQRLKPAPAGVADNGATSLAEWGVE